MTKQAKQTDQPIIHRLMRKVEGGGLVIAGHQKIENGRIYHKRKLSLPELESYKDISEILHIRDYTELKNWASFDRVDRWTGLKYPDGRLVFEKDLTLDDGFGEDDEYIVTWMKNECCYVLKKIDSNFSKQLTESEIQHHKFLGIEGTKEA